MKRTIQPVQQVAPFSDGPQPILKSSMANLVLIGAGLAAAYWGYYNYLRPVHVPSKDDDSNNHVRKVHLDPNQPQEKLRPATPEESSGVKRSAHST